MREKIIAKIKAVREQLTDTRDHEERRVLLEQLCILYAQLASAHG